MNERKQRVPEGHVCVTLLNSVSATLSKEPFDLRSAIGSLPTERWAQKPLLGSDLHHPSLFLAEAPTVCPRPFQVPLSFQLWALMFAMQPEEKGSSVGQSGNAKSGKACSPTWVSAAPYSIHVVTGQLQGLSGKFCHGL